MAISNKKSPKQRGNKKQLKPDLKSIDKPKKKLGVKKKKSEAIAPMKKAVSKKKDIKDDAAVTSDPQTDDLQAPVKEAKPKAALKSTLQETDPEFYEFLKNEDKELLDFEPDSDDSEMDVSEADDESEDDGPPKKLEVASDQEESDEPEEDEDPSETTSKKSDLKKPQLTIKLINQWSDELPKGKKEILMQVVTAFSSAVQEMSAVRDDKEKSSKYHVEGSAVFNTIVRLCLTQLLPTLNKQLDIKKPEEGKKPELPSKSVRWNKFRSHIKAYCSALLALLGEMKEPAVLNALLKHVHQMVGYMCCFPPLARVLAKRLVAVWVMFP